MRKILIDEVDARIVLELLESAHVATNLVWIRNDCCEVLREALAAQPAQQSAVAWVDVKHTDFGPYDFHGKELLPVGRHDLYTSPQAQPAPEIAIADAYRAGVDSGIAAEREACAEMCSDIDGGENMFSRAIRARGNT